MERKTEFRKQGINRSNRAYSSDSAFSEDEGWNETRELSREYIHTQNQAYSAAREEPNLQNRSFCLTANRDETEVHCSKKCTCDERTDEERIDLLYDPQSFRRLSQSYVSTVEQHSANRNHSLSQYTYTLDNVVYADPTPTPSPTKTPIQTPIPPTRTSLKKTQDNRRHATSTFKQTQHHTEFERKYSEIKYNERSVDDYVGHYQIPTMPLTNTIDELETASEVRRGQLYYTISQSLENAKLLDQNEIDQLVSILLRDCAQSDEALKLTAMKVLYAVVSNRNVKIDPTVISMAMLNQTTQTDVLNDLAYRILNLIVVHYHEFINSREVFNHVYATIVNSYKDDSFPMFAITVLSSLLGKDKTFSTKVNVQTLLDIYFTQKRRRHDLLPITTACAIVASDLPVSRQHFFTLIPSCCEFLRHEADNLRYRKQPNYARVKINLVLMKHVLK